jgi:hypothetical protein
VSGYYVWFIKRIKYVWKPQEKGLHFECFTQIFKQEELQAPAKPNRERQSGLYPKTEAIHLWSRPAGRLYWAAGICIESSGRTTLPEDLPVKIRF